MLLKMATIYDDYHPIGRTNLEDGERGGESMVVLISQKH